MPSQGQVTAFCNNSQYYSAHRRHNTTEKRLLSEDVFGAIRGNFHTLENLQAEGHAQTSMPSWMSSREFCIQDPGCIFFYKYCPLLNPAAGLAVREGAFYAIPRQYHNEKI
jgi:hypothetical protein